MRRALVAGLVLALASLTACEAEGDEEPAVADRTATPIPADATTMPSDVPAVTEGPLADAVFLTAVDQIVAGTVYEGLVDVTPGEFLVTADLVCERLDAGADRDELLVAYLEALGTDRQPSEEDARLAGALVGAGIEVYCSHHGR